MSDGQGEGKAEEAASPGTKSAADALREAMQSVQSGAARTTTLPEHLRHLPERERAQELTLKQVFAQQEYDLRQRYAFWILIILGVQLLIADGVFIAFAQIGESWVLSPGVIQVWLAATVVQVVGIVLVVTRHLFPNKNHIRKVASVE
jgi:thiosulfate reductase cytochrome b subunit